MAGETDRRLPKIGPIGEVELALVVLSTELFEKPIRVFYDCELDPTGFQLNDAAC